MATNPSTSNRAGIGGPKTEAGKAISSRNAIKHGLTGAFRIMPEFSESREKYEELLVQLKDEHQPATQTEYFLVEQLAQNMTLMNRAGWMLSEFAFHYEIQRMNSFMRYQNMYKRDFYKCLDELRKLRKDREQRSEFVSQNVEVVESKAAEAAAAAPAQFVSQKPATAPSIASQKQEILDTARRMQAEIAETLQSIKTAMHQ